MGGADLAAREQRAQRRGGLALAAMAAQRVDARVERRVRAARGVERQRAGRQRRAKQGLRLEQADERVRGRELRAVEERQPLLRLQRERLESDGGERFGRRHDRGRRARASPTPIIAAAMWASGARSPEAPTEPCEGTTGVTPRSSIASMQSIVSGRTPEAPCARLASFSAIMSRVTATGVGSPTPAACDSTMLR